MNNNHPINLRYYLHDQETVLSFSNAYSGNKITGVRHSLSDQIREIQIITDCNPEQPMIPYPDIYKSPEVLDIQLAQIMAIESHYCCELPEYARLVRILLLELHRLLNHFNFFSTLAFAIQFSKLLEKSVANSSIVRTVLLKIDDVQSLNKYFIIGGIAADLPTGFIEYLTDSIQCIRKSLSFFKKQLDRKTLLSNLLESVGIISQNDAKIYSLSGPNLYASLAQSEYNLDTISLLPKSINPEPVTTNYHKGTIGDSWHRSWVRFLEIEQSLRLINQLSNVILKTDIKLMIQPFISGRDSDFLFNLNHAEGQIISHIRKSQHNHYITGKHQYPVVNVIENLDSILIGERVSSAKIILSSLNLNPVKYIIH